MTHVEAKGFIDNIFTLIKKAESTQNLISIEQTEFDNKFKMDTNSYPKIKFKISPVEIDNLIRDNILDKDFNIMNDASSNITDPLTKLLYSLAWKNGDLIKLKHIAKGISEIESDSLNQDSALVFYQFGKFLTKTEGQPIIDQHVIRAFSIYKLTDFVQIEKSRKLNTITKKEKGIVVEYINWLKSSELSSNLRLENDYSYFIDRILFATGRKTKISKK